MTPDHEHEILNAIKQLKRALNRVASLTKYMNKSEGVGIRNIKVGEYTYPNTDRGYTATSKIMLCGQWLKKSGFEYGQRIKVITMCGLIIIAHEPNEFQLKK